MEVVFTYLQANWIELLGSVLSIIYLYLSIKQKASLWIFGFLCSALYVVVFFQSKFYADMSLQFYYLGVSVFGWISWKAGKPENREELPVKRTTPLSGAIILIIALVLYFLYYFILSEYTDSPLPKADSFTTALSIVATWMLARKMIEHWWLWIIVDSVSAGLYFYRALYPTAILFVIYTIMAIIGYLQWKKSLSK
ncbi:MAG: nicotinamide riboside transporter PnuC [Paludibacter sp.]|nr:nicotinamide riboside transporter PnuC [Paludibacter sp.]